MSDTFSLLKQYIRSISSCICSEQLSKSDPQKLIIQHDSPPLFNYVMLLKISVGLISRFVESIFDVGNDQI